MKRKLTALLMGLFLVLLAPSCRHELDCPGFDTEEDIMYWYMLPSLASQVSYVDSNGITFTFNQTDYSASEAYTFKCGGFTKCGCSPALLTTKYYNSDLDLTFRFNTQYEHYPMINLVHDSILYELDVDLTNNTIHTRDTLYNVTPIDTFTIFNTNYFDVFEVTSQLDDFKFWLKKNAGMVAFEKGGILYKLN